jgi:nicotinate phosphoribosyltransferase
VCKVIDAGGHATVKLSDNPSKAMGPATEIARYRKVFHAPHQEPLKLTV